MTENTTSTAVFSKMFRLQLMSTAVVAIASLIISGSNACVSALLGGAAVIIAAFAASIIAQRKSVEAAAALVNLLKAEVLKVLIIVVLLFMVFKVYKQLVPLALILGLAAAALVSGAAISQLDKTDIEI